MEQDEDYDMQDADDEEDLEAQALFSNMHHPFTQISMLKGPEETSPTKKPVLDENEKLPAWKKIHRGSLPNDFKYVLLPNKTPPGRIEAFLEVRVGSIDESDEEQGLAHFLEHVVFLGTEKYPTSDIIRNLLARWGMSFGPDANAFTEFRRTVYTFHIPVSENSAQERNQELFNALDVLYQLTFKALLVPEAIEIERGPVLSELAMSNSIDYRIEYNKFQQIHGHNVLSKRFPIGKEDKLKKMKHQDIKDFYDRYYKCNNMTLYICGQIDVKDTVNIVKQIFGSEKSTKLPDPVPIFHDWKRPQELVSLFQHELVSQFTLTLTLLSPSHVVQTVKDFRLDMIATIIDICLEQRIYALEQTYADPPFTEISWEYFNSHREGCTTNSFIINAHPEEWKEAVSVAMTELQRLITYGMTQAEFSESLGSLLKEAHRDAEQDQTQDSADLLEMMIDLEHMNSPFIDKKTEYKLMMQVAQTISISDVNSTIKEIFAHLGKFPIDSTASVFVAAPLRVNSKAFTVKKEEIVQVIEKGLKEAKNIEEKSAPSEIISEKQIMKKFKKLKPKYVQPIDKRKSKPVIPANSTKIEDPATGVILMKLSNGISINIKKTAFEAKQATLKLNARGGTSMEREGEYGAVVVGMQTFIGGGAGEYSSEELFKFCNFHGITMDLGTTAESVWITFDFSVSHSGTQRVLELLHLFLTDAKFDERCFERSRKSFMVDAERVQKEVEMATFNALMKVILDPADRRFVNPEKQEFQKLTRNLVRNYIVKHLSTNNLELCLVGDINLGEVEDLVLKYLGTVPPSPSPFEKETPRLQLSFSPIPKTVSIRVDDDQERAFMNIAMRSINRWGKLGKFSLEFNSDEPLYASRVLYILCRVIENRLFNIIREKMGLTYEMSFSAAFYDYYDSGMIFASTSPFLNKIDETLSETVKILKDFKNKNISQEELDEVLVPMIRSIRTSLNSNHYWINLLAGLQNPSLPKDLRSISQIPEFYEAIQVKDLHHVLELFYDPDLVYVSIGSSGGNSNNTPTMDSS